ncbi:MAG: type IV secretory system conjugative DNA transfer family protein [Candidatus Eremiobacteraeota bacterium]|nr:type IV secretory system conjugative DNA transfer family protein [Candidatus Eremiobacteraeota bacterium]MBC5802707.1 type IV secretory system conjugative DNA transfer family protein [Candidatus Eremiobacteraeota bacterium]MBC5823020.1 type IV secretory system conjugative DNA transfer family protein [Candidatus Eremiobacteraeota bacterium]
MDLRERAPSQSLSLGTGDGRIDFGLDDLCRHTMIFGSSGSGKTTRGYNPMLQSMLSNLGAGAFVICAKTEAVGEVCEIARRAGRKSVVVQPGSEIGLELMCGSPDVDSVYFRDTFGRVSEDAKQWVDAGLARMKNALRMLQAAGDQYYTFEHLTSYCFDDKFAALVRIQATERLRAIRSDSDEAWTIHEALSYEDTRYFQMMPETRRTVQFAISQLLEPLRDVDIAKTFGRKHNLISMNSVFEGNVIVLHVPRSRYERAAQSLYTLAKRRFFTAVENRRSDPTLDQARPVVFGIDEYQLCISESDVSSLGVIRSAGCMVLGTTQGVASLYAVLAPHHVDAALQNFTQKIFFKTDDDATLGLLARATKYNKSSVDPGVLFSMTRDQAFCHVTAGDRSIDAVVGMKPMYVTPSPVAEMRSPPPAAVATATSTEAVA